MVDSFILSKTFMFHHVHAEHGGTLVNNTSPTGQVIRIWPHSPKGTFRRRKSVFPIIPRDLNAP